MTNREARRHFTVTIPQKVQGIVELSTEENKTTPLNALRAFYHSETYRKLETEETKYWHLGPINLFARFKEETATCH